LNLDDQKNQGKQSPEEGQGGFQEEGEPVYHDIGKDSAQEEDEEEGEKS